MEISIAVLTVVIIKCAGMVGSLGLSFLFICWPINDKPTTKTQYFIWAIVNIIVAILIFTNLVTFTR